MKPLKLLEVAAIFSALLKKNKLASVLGVVRGRITWGYISSAWRRAKVVFIPKGVKKDPFHPKFSRTMYLPTFVLKTVEKVIANYIWAKVIMRNSVHSFQLSVGANMRKPMWWNPNWTKNY